MQDNLRTVNVGLIGLGTVGGGVARTILSHHDRYLDAYNIDLEIARACGLVWEQAEAADVYKRQVHTTTERTTESQPGSPRYDVAQNETYAPTMITSPWAKLSIVAIP